MKELSPEQKKTMTRVSREFERFWQIYTFPDKATMEDLAWAKDFLISGLNQIKSIAELEEDPAWHELYKLVYLGLFHTDYQLPVEFRYKDPKRN